MWTGFKNEHARKGSDHTSAFLPCRHIYLQLLLQDFSKDFMLISKNTESCRLNIVSTGCNTAAAPAAAADLLIYLPEPSRAAVPSLLSLLCSQAAEFWPTVLWLHYHAVSQWRTTIVEGCWMQMNHRVEWTLTSLF